MPAGAGKELAKETGALRDSGSSPGARRGPGEEGSLLQYSPENPMDRVNCGPRSADERQH